MHASLLIAALLPLAAAHGFLSYPPPRGIQKEGYQVDDLKSPNTKGLCRGEPEGKHFPVKAGQSLTLGLTITAPHTGPCRVTILDRKLKNERPVAEKFDCAAPGGPGKWTIKLPSDLKGHYVLRWYWEGRHVSPGEPYEQCIDLDFGKGGNDNSENYDKDEDEGQRVDGQGRNNAPSTRPPTYTPPTPAPSYDNKPAPPSYNNGNQDSSRRRHRQRRPSKNEDDNQGSYNNGGNGGSSGGSCSAGSYKCSSSSSGFYQCANGSWVKMACPAGTACQKMGQQITCGYAK